MIVEHVVKSGDSLSWIARKYKTTVAQIAKLNNIADPNKLEIGQVLKIMTDGADGTTNQIKGSVVDSVIVVPEYYVVVGFEVNNPEAFVNETHNLAVDYGHAFFYVVLNKVVTKFFSFGPSGGGEVGWFDKGSATEPNKYNTGAIIKDGYKNARPGTPDYGISEKIKVFKISLTISQGVKLEAETDTVRNKIISGKQKYTAYLNDTCAETARDVLTSAGIETPSGSSKVKHSGVANFPIAYAVNPYMWHSSFIKAGKVETSFTPPVTSMKKWTPSIGYKDPIFRS
jgi:LysM repeat protein